MITYTYLCFLHLIEVNLNLKYIIIQEKKTIQAMQKNNAVLCFLNYIIEGQSNNLYQEKFIKIWAEMLRKKELRNMI